jgi:hypothetical protein
VTSDNVTCFVAYPSNPPDRAESIEEAIQRIKDGKAVDILGWKDLRITGRLIISAICDAIGSKDLFIADLTGLNSNVLFELGYALVNRKRLWLLLNTSIEKAKTEFDRFGLLTTIYYQHFNSSEDIEKAFYTDLPFQDLDNVLYDELLQASGTPNMPDALLYIKPDINTDAVRRITRRVNSGPMRSVIDDPSEMPTQPLSWYAQQVDSSFAVVTHFLAEDHEGYRVHNAKHALVSGMAFGLGRPLLMLAHAPYSSPLDYKDLLRVHDTARKAEAIFDNWLAPNLYAYEARIKAAQRKQAQQRVRGELRSIAIGDPIAENESESVTEYFVPTAAYTEALESTHSIFIGRKGAGKTATLYKLSSELGADPRNHLCVVKPVDYEIEGILAMLRQELSRSEKGYLVESFWKFLLYTELTRSINEEILSKPDYYGRTEGENKLVEFVAQHSTSITPEFSSRLEAVVERLRGLTELAEGEARKLRISEMLHAELISKMRDLLGKVLTSKAKVVLLVDNLDKAWTKDADIELLSGLLYGLLSVSGRVSEDFRRSASGLKPVKLHFTLFLRSDIFAAMLHFAKERDKLPVRRLTWEDPETLRAVVEERFARSSTSIDSPTEIWSRYFCTTVEGVPIRDYLESIVFPRPRDIIYLVKSALHHAVNRRRDRIEESDMLAATKEYSRFSFNSFLAEVSARIPESEDFLLYFLQVPEIITREHILGAMTGAGISGERLQEIVELLGELTFLGFEVYPNKFEFIYDEQNTQKVFLMAEKTRIAMSQDSPRFRIHPALHSFLEIQPNRSYRTGQIIMDLAGE